MTFLGMIWPFGLFRDASVKNKVAAWEAYKHNHAMRNVLLPSMLFWASLGSASLSMMVFLEEQCRPDKVPRVVSAALGCGIAWIAVVLFVSFVSWVWLSCDSTE